MTGSYYLKNVRFTPVTELTTTGKIAAGGWSWLQLLANFNYC